MSKRWYQAVFVVFVVVVAAVADASAQGSLLGSTIQLNVDIRDSIDCPDANSAQGSRLIGDGIEWMGLDNSKVPFLVFDVDIDISAEAITVDFDRAGSGFLCRAVENTLVFRDLTDSLPPIESVELDQALTVLPGLDPEDVTFSENEIRINPEGTFYTPESFIRVVVAVEGSDPCPADTNGNGAADPGDFTAWVAAYNAGDLVADVNENGAVDPGDFTAWIAAYNAGC